MSRSSSGTASYALVHYPKGCMWIGWYDMPKSPHRRSSWMKKFARRFVRRNNVKITVEQLNAA